MLFFGRLKKKNFPKLRNNAGTGRTAYLCELLPTNNNRKSNKKHLLSIIVGLFIYDVYFIDY